MLTLMNLSKNLYSPSTLEGTLPRSAKDRRILRSAFLFLLAFSGFEPATLLFSGTKKLKLLSKFVPPEWPESPDGQNLVSSVNMFLPFWPMRVQFTESISSHACKVEDNMEQSTRFWLQTVTAGKWIWKNWMWVIMSILYVENTQSTGWKYII